MKTASILIGSILVLFSCVATIVLQFAKLDQAVDIYWRITLIDVKALGVLFMVLYLSISKEDK